MLRRFRELYQHLPAKQRRHLWLTFALMVLGTVAEIVTIGAVVPFLSILVGSGSGDEPDGSFALLPVDVASTLSEALILLGVAALGASALRVLLLWTSQSTVAGIGNVLSRAVFDRALHLPYAEQVRHHSSITLSMAQQVQRTSSTALLPAMEALTSSIIAAFILIFLMHIQPLATLVGGGFIAILYVLLALLCRPALNRNGRVLSEAGRSRTRTIQDAAGGIRDIILDYSQKAVTERFGKIDRAFRRAQMLNSFLTQAPRFLVEAIGVVGVAITAVGIAATSDNDFVSAVPSLGALALGAQRLLPLLQHAYGGWSQVAGNLHALDEVLNLLRLPVEEPASGVATVPIRFEKIQFDTVEFAYPAGAPVLRGASLTIVAGERLAITGPTGHGKSTLIDLLLGLMEPSAGSVWVDDGPLTADRIANWRASVAHVPQSIFLVDDSVAANIAFPAGVADVPARDVEAAARMAELLRTESPDWLQMPVGERGVRLSGGQRQRIGIARALLRRPKLLVLDEAMNALDEDTEAAVMSNLRGIEKLTIVAVTHRKSILSQFDRTILVENGGLSELPAQPAIPGAVL